MELIAILAVTEAATVTIIGALLTAVVGPVVVVWVQTRRTRQRVEAAKETIGEKPEGDDRSMIQLMHDFITAQAKQDARLAAHDALHAAHDRRLDDHHHRLTKAEEALRRLHGEDAA